MMSQRGIPRGLALLALVSILGCDSSHHSNDSVQGVNSQFVGPVQPSVSLEDPRAMETLRASRPEHYRKINELLAGLSAHTELDGPRWAKASFGADNLSVSAVLYTSLPPKQYVTFNLEGTNYTALVPQQPYVAPMQVRR